MTLLDLTAIVELLIVLGLAFIACFFVVAIICYVEDVLKIRFIYKKSWKDAFKLDGPPYA